MQPIKYCYDVLHWNINLPLTILICIILRSLKKCWKSVCDKVQRKRTIDEGDESWAGGYFNHRNINSRQEYYHFLNQNIAALLNAGGTFSEKIFFDLDWITPILRGVMIWMIVMMTIAKLMSVLSKRMEFFWQYFQLLCFSVTRTTLTLCESLFSLNLSMQHCPLCFLLVYMPKLDSNVFLAKYIPSVFFHDMKRREHIS